MRYFRGLFIPILLTISLISSVATAGPLFQDPSIKQISGPTVSAVPAGGLVLLHFWASWCGRCSTMFSDLAAHATPKNGVQFVTVSIDEDVQAARDYLAKTATSPDTVVLHDSAGYLAKRFSADSVPLVILIDADGKELFRMSGHPTQSKIFKLVQSIKSAGGHL